MSYTCAKILNISIPQSNLLKQSAVQNKFSWVVRPFRKFGKIYTLGNNPLYGINLNGEQWETREDEDEDEGLLLALKIVRDDKDEANY